MSCKRWRMLVWACKPQKDKMAKIEIADMGEFDELVLCHPETGRCWLHVEQMSKRGYFIDIDGKRLHVNLKKNGGVSVRDVETGEVLEPS